MIAHGRRLTTRLRTAGLLTLFLLTFLLLLTPMCRGQVSTNDDVATLVRDLQDNDPRVSSMASSRLARLGKESNAALAAVTKLLGAEDKRLRAQAVFILREIGPAAVPALVEV